MSMAQASGAAGPRPMTREERKVILASSLGTVFEWYDFYLYGSLATMIGAHFFSAFDANTRAIFALLAFAAGFLVRPFGALFFGRLGDLIGRKYTFLVTILIMGASTFLVGLLPSYAAIGWIAPVILIALRMLQGLALGGEYGGAAVYVAEHAPPGRRGFYTSWIQTTATLGLLLSLIVILGIRTLMGEADFAAWGWRIPFLASILLLGISVYIRLQMQESPAFQKMKAEGTGSKAPLSEAFGQWKNAKIALLALFGLTAGQAVVWYTGQFYALFFIQSILKVDLYTSNVLIAWALILGTGGFIVFGSLSDRIGRKPIILAGCLIAALTYFPLFGALTKAANPGLAAAHENVKVQVVADPATCGSVFDPVGVRTFTQPCDIARRALASQAIQYTQAPAPAGTAAKVTVNGKDVAIDAAFAANIGKEAVAAGYPAPGDARIVKTGFLGALFSAQSLTIIAILTVLVIYVTMVYGPIAAALVELFPTRIRYTGMSLPYHIGNGWFGGLLPATSFAMVAGTGDIFYGLWYPIVIAMMTFVIGMLFVPETKDRDILTHDNG
ncbi:Sugar transporter [Bosea sp. 62]|uniref:MFS transporter n=1 Tax=unclassified Bosea (in: a-proteobacteria) TaxID=2653178 RepID=UPI001251E5FF|nr:MULTISPECIES: MFS transporter [unclassified Bosea (in: a-proteobacteria)]CAD5254996.1 Sugar transporter [Bosea sp. 46]CAD5258890.1 Sugar transporter [Bosea sp. 21B]CAD5281965.1 Sugar transporter [Bosea sp. 7B]VVT57895.1 Sugar transporter [Bosea sp. EC-HK365B]VXB43006.1 Sugar transporter [Bosea sp. 29B]